MVTKKATGAEAERQLLEVQAKVHIRKQAFKEAADHLRTVAKDLLRSRESAASSAPKFIQETAAFRMETRRILEQMAQLEGCAAAIELME